MRHTIKLLVMLGLLATVGQGSAQIAITYWQYDLPTKVTVLDELIAEFNDANPDIIVRQETFPYDAYPQQVAAATAARQGPDIVNLFYGWTAAWLRAGYIEPLPQEHFDHAWIEEYFVPMVDGVKFGGEYYGLPTAVRSLALFYNKDMFREAGLDPEAPPTTWAEFVETAKAMTIRRGPLFTQVGYGFGGQDHHLIRTVLMNQLGTSPYSADNREVLYGGEIGTLALKTYTDWQLVDQIGVLEFVPGTSGYRDGFMNQANTGMIIDGSFAITQIRNNAAGKFEWGVAELPTFENGVRSNYGSFWMNGLTAKAFESPARLEAASRFIRFLTTEEVMDRWLTAVGELPAARAKVSDPALADDPVLGAFIAGLAYAEATPFVDEIVQRVIMLDAFNRVLLQGMDPAESMAVASQTDQDLLDQFAD